MNVTYGKCLPEIAVVALLFSVAPALAQDAAPTPNIPLQKTIGQVTPTGPVPSLFVLNSDGATLKDGKLTMTGVDMNAIVFADRPVSAAGHVMTEQFVQQWDEGRGNFAIDPPNATISVLGGDGSDVDDAVVTLTNPVLDGKSLTFDVAVLEGGITKSGPAALFIDDRGFGGFHGGFAHVEGPRGGTADFAHVGGYHGYGGGSYWHAPVYHGAWYGVGAVAAGAAVGSAIASTHPGYYGGYAYPPYCRLCPVSALLLTAVPTRKGEPRKIYFRSIRPRLPNSPVRGACAGLSYEN